MYFLRRKGPSSPYPSSFSRHLLFSQHKFKEFEGLELSPDKNNVQDQSLLAVEKSAKWNLGISWYVLPLITFRKKQGRYYCKNAFVLCFCQKPFVKLAMCLLPIRLDVAQQCLPFAAVIGGGGGGGRGGGWDEDDGKGNILFKNWNIPNLSQLRAFFLAFCTKMILTW